MMILLFWAMTLGMFAVATRVGRHFGLIPIVSQLLLAMLAALTTWLSFGLLAVSSTPAVSNFGLSVSLGLAFSFILAPWAGRHVHTVPVAEQTA